MGVVRVYASGLKGDEAGALFCSLCHLGEGNWGTPHLRITVEGSLR